MVKIQEHKQKMREIKEQAYNSTGKRKKQLMKCYHRLQKQLTQCEYYLKGGADGKQQELKVNR